MGRRKELSVKLATQTHVPVIRRDKGRCVLCGKKAHDIHEIVSKSHFGTRTLAICYQVKNRVCLCRKCHQKVQGRRKYARELLELLREKHGYVYEEYIFRRFLG